MPQKTGDVGERSGSGTGILPVCCLFFLKLTGKMPVPLPDGHTAMSHVLVPMIFTSVPGATPEPTAAKMRVERADRDRNTRRQTGFLCPTPPRRESANRAINRVNACRQT